MSWAQIVKRTTYVGPPPGFERLLPYCFCPTCQGCKADGHTWTAAKHVNQIRTILDSENIHYCIESTGVEVFIMAHACPKIARKITRIQT